MRSLQEHQAREKTKPKSLVKVTKPNQLYSSDELTDVDTDTQKLDEKLEEKRAAVRALEEKKMERVRVIKILLLIILVIAGDM